MKGDETTSDETTSGGVVPILPKDLKKLHSLALRSKVEWGGSMEMVNGTLRIKRMVKGSEYGMNMKVRRGDIPFHIHTKRMVEEECGNDFPSSHDIEAIVEDKIEKEIELHVLITPSTVFYIRSFRTTPLNDEYLYSLDERMCERKISLSRYVELLRRKKVTILYRKIVI